jgi:hypothetical protein
MNSRVTLPSDLRIMSFQFSAVSSTNMMTVRICQRELHPCRYFFFPCGATAPIGALAYSPFHFGLLDLRHSVGILGRVISSLQGLYLHTNKRKHTYTHTNKRSTSMPWVGFEPTIPASDRAKTVHALDCSATVTGPVPPLGSWNFGWQQIFKNYGKFRNVL